MKPNYLIPVKKCFSLLRIAVRLEVELVIKE